MKVILVEMSVVSAEHPSLAGLAAASLEHPDAPFDVYEGVIYRPVPGRAHEAPVDPHWRPELSSLVDGARLDFMQPGITLDNAHRSGERDLYLVGAATGGHPGQEDGCLKGRSNESSSWSALAMSRWPEVGQVRPRLQ